MPYSVIAGSRFHPLGCDPQPTISERLVTDGLPRDPVAALPLTHIAYHVLLALATGNRHGYGIIKHVAARTDGRVDLEAGTLYAAIKRMKDEGWIKEAPAVTGADARRRTYAITDYGGQILLAESRRLEELVELARAADVLPDGRTARA